MEYHGIKHGISWDQTWNIMGKKRMNNEHHGDVNDQLKQREYVS